MRTLSITLLAVTLLFSSCMKHASDLVLVYGSDPNTWSFSDGSTNYEGVFYESPVVNTTAQGNGTYLLSMTGKEKISGKLLTMAIALTDLDFMTRSYQSGISGSDLSTAFYYTGSAGSRDGIYSSTNNDPGAVITYNIISYNPDKNLMTLSFNGEAFDVNGNIVKIANGKLSANINWN